MLIRGSVRPAIKRNMETIVNIVPIVLVFCELGFIEILINRSKSMKFLIPRATLELS